MTDNSDPTASGKPPRLNLIDLAVVAVVLGIICFFLFVVLSSINL